MTISPIPSLVIREGATGVFYEAKFRWGGRQVKRRLGPAWVERDTAGWRRKAGRAAPGYLDPKSAQRVATELAESFVRDATEVERVEAERKTAGVTFREVAHAYLRWAQTAGARKPSTMAQHRLDLSEPGVPHKRGVGVSPGHIMGGLGDLPAARIAPREVEAVLDRIAAGGVSNRTVNRYRAVISAIFNFGMKPTTFDLPDNPAARTDKRRQRAAGALIYFSPVEIERAAVALAAGKHRKGGRARGPWEAHEDAQDADAVRIAAYAGLRLGELLALRWRNVDFSGSALTVEAALSDGIESTPKSGSVRRVPLAAQAADALRRLAQRKDFLAPDDLVICNAYGRHINGSALRRRYKAARDAAGLRPLRWHDLRHTFGSLLVAGGVDLVTVKDAMGHSEITTTQRYLHARPATETAERFTRAFALGATDGSAPISAAA